jgi:hypothetical protein
MQKIAKVLRILRQKFPVQSMINHKQPKDVEYFKYLGSTITNDASRTREIKSMTVTAKSAFNKKDLFTSKRDLN